MKRIAKVFAICVVMVLLGACLTGVTAEVINQESTGAGVNVNVEELEYLPVGSVVRLEGGKVNVVIVARALIVNDAYGQPVYFDYGAFIYPHGLVDGNMAYFQRDTIEEVLFVGYIDEDEKQIVQQLIQFEEANKDIPRGNKDSLLIRN